MMPYKVGHFTLDTGKKRALDSELRTGCFVSDSGIYRVIHKQHRLPEEVTLIKDQSFPRCSKCAEPAYFKLVRSAPASGGTNSSSVALYELSEAR
jgi:hypothetical protein